MIITDIAPKLLQIIYDKTVGNPNCNNLMFYPNTEMLSETLQVTENDVGKCIHYLLSKGYITSDGSINARISITALGIDTIENSIQQCHIKTT